MNDDQQKPPQSEDEAFRFDRSDLEDQEVQKIHAQLMREKEEPREGFAAPPMIILFMCMFLCLWAGAELTKSSADFRWDAYDPDYNSGGGGGAAKPYDPLVRGKRVFNNCITCHQTSGEGLPGIYPPLKGSDWVGKSPEVLVRIVLNGLSGDIVVNGNPYNSVMSPFNNLSDKDIAAVLSYVRNSWGNSYPIVEETEVAAIRATVGSRSASYTPAELLEMFPE